MYIGFRVELPSKLIDQNIERHIKKYNKSGDSRIFDLHDDGRITAEKTKNMIIARGTQDKKYNSGMINFSIMIPIEKDLLRVVEIVNILGNGRLIRERVKIFVEGKSTLNQLPELKDLTQAFDDAESIMPGLIKSGWYYAPEAIF